MPTYDYRCEACGHAFEHFQSMTSRRLRKCPACGAPKLVRLVGSGAGVIFRGSGFYETDYKRAGEKRGAPQEAPASDGATKAKDATSPKEGGPAATPAPASPTQAGGGADSGGKAGGGTGSGPEAPSKGGS